MHRIDGPGATGENQFTEGNPGTGTPATVVTDDWLNAIQEEVAGVVEASGAELAKGNNGQLLAALKTALWPETGYLPLPAAAFNRGNTSHDWSFSPLSATPGASGTHTLVGCLTVPPGLRITAVRFRFTAASSGSVGFYVVSEDEELDSSDNLPGAGTSLDIPVSPGKEITAPYQLGFSLVATNAVDFEFESAGVVVERSAFPEP